MSAYTASIWMVKVSALSLVTTQRSGSARRWQGGVIQLSGL